MALESLAHPLLHINEGQDVVLPSSANGLNEHAILEDKTEIKRAWFFEELTLQFTIAGPMIIVNILDASLNVVSLMFIGHLGTLALSSASIAYTMAGATGYSIVMGLSSGLETLCGQAFGAKEYPQCGIFLQRAILVQILVCVPVSFIWWNIAPVLMFIGQDPAISHSAQEYSRCLLPALFAFAFHLPLVKFLQAQSAVNAIAVSTGITLAIHIPLFYFIIYYFGFGLRGAALANGISGWINVAFLVLYVYFAPSCKNTWTGLSTESLEDIWIFLKVAIPSTVMSCLELWCYESMILLSGLLPNPVLETSTFTICLNAIGLTSIVPLGLGAAVSTRVSNELGAGRPYAAKSAVKLTVSMALLEGFTLSMLFISVRNVWPYLFTADAEVVKYAGSMVPFLAVLTILFACKAVLYGVATGCGWQHLGAYTNLGSFYVIALPIGLLMAFYYHFNGYGLWIGITCGAVTQVFLFAFITSTRNWQKLADDAQLRVQNAEHHIHHDLLPTTKTKEDPSLLSQEQN